MQGRGGEKKIQEVGLTWWIKQAEVLRKRKSGVNKSVITKQTHYVSYHLGTEQSFRVPVGEPVFYTGQVMRGLVAGEGKQQETHWKK